MKIAGVQYLRAIAAIAVVLDHCCGMAAFDKYYGRKSILFDFLVSGSFGVNLFFLISGFIIVVSSTKFKSLTPSKTLGDFFKARAIRILPMMWLTIISYATLRILGRGSAEWHSYLNAFFLIPFGDYDPNNIWTLRQEAIFYIIFGLTFLSGRKLWPVFLFWILIPFLPQITALAQGVPASRPIGHQILLNFLSPVNVLFGGGAAIGLLYRKREDLFHDNMNRVISALQTWPALVIMFLIAMTILKGDIISPSNVLLSLPIFTIMLVIGAIEYKKINRIFYYLGNASYAIYLFHLQFISAFLGIFSKHAHGMPVTLAIATISATTIAISCAIYSFVEVPLTKYLMAKLIHRPKEQSAPIAAAE
ncbi:MULTISPECIES: acyltransferase family protein [unclassified Novosphingobium]|uniref:acyltransferase family protein n=1 Tax=unclassified Novosphingobium TaxID=2644732 RepID=UPI000A684261|nr:MULTISPECIES: acyltransferase [unclassified Novosphingobium]MBN9142835.1 acyltransferase [Novosphingobium sp.]MDR6705920.1 exopolysaccharide production protein ExoZ [Novosphingobium sp. 1748]